MSWDAVWNILKWVLAALAAGFIGQFGRVFAMRLIQRRRAGGTGDSSDRLPSVPRPNADREAELRALEKIEKKRAKAEVKRAKKGEG